MSKKIIALPTREGNIDDHFGHCDHYTIVTIEDENIISTETLPSPQGCGCKSNIASILQDMGVTLMIAGNMGDGAFNKLTNHSIEVIRGCHGEINTVIKQYLSGTLKDSQISCDHHDCGNHSSLPTFVGYDK